MRLREASSCYASAIVTFSSSSSCAVCSSFTFPLLLLLHLFFIRIFLSFVLIFYLLAFLVSVYATLAEENKVSN